MKTRGLLKFLTLATIVCGGSASLAVPIVFTATLPNAPEVVANASTATGFARLTWDDVAHTMRVEVSFSGLSANTTASHVHCCTATSFQTSPGAGVATELPSFTGFPLGVTSGTYDHTFDTSLAATWNPTFLNANGGTAASASAAFLAGLLGARAYLNIHTTAFPGGEIRGFLRVPEPATLGLLSLGLLGLGMRRRFQPAAQ